MTTTTNNRKQEVVVVKKKRSIVNKLNTVLKQLGINPSHFLSKIGNVNIKKFTD